MRFLSLAILLMFLSQCHIREKIEILTEVEEAMEQEFRHDQIDLAMNWGEKSFLVITFEGYDLENKSWEDLESTANMAKDFALASDPTLEDLTYFMIIFTSEPVNGEPLQKAQFRINKNEF
ncbi:MAG: hypothetical protein P8X57_10310 [Cyclobacteriaceae bacterium]